MKTPAGLMLAAVLAVAGSVPLVAHHSFAAEFDDTQPLKLTGTITKVEWSNPHIWYALTIDDPKIFSAPWSQEFEIIAKPEWESAGLYEYVCEENNRCPGGKCGGK